jgi:hypothetical protein
VAAGREGLDQADARSAMTGTPAAHRVDRMRGGVPSMRFVSGGGESLPTDFHDHDNQRENRQDDFGEQIDP